MSTRNRRGIETSRRHFWFVNFAISLWLCGSIISPSRADALAKLKPEKLEAVHQAIQELRAEWKRVPRQGPYREYRANLHVHSSRSHDSRGTIEEIVSAAKSVGTSVLMFTEHPSDKHDYFKDGHRGLKDGVLLIPGAETGGFLVFPPSSRAHSNRDSPASGPVYTGGSPQEFANLIHGRNGLIFLSHLEERM